MNAGHLAAVFAAATAFTQVTVTRISQAGLVQAKWTNEILDEMFRALGRNRPDIASDKLDRLRQLMNGAVRDCLVSGYEPIIEGLKLPDPGDRHILAAASRLVPRSSSPAT